MKQFQGFDKNECKVEVPKLISNSSDFHGVITLLAWDEGAGA